MSPYSDYRSGALGWGEGVRCVGGYTRTHRGGKGGLRGSPPPPARPRGYLPTPWRRGLPLVFRSMSGSRAAGGGGVSTEFLKGRRGESGGDRLPPLSISYFAIWQSTSGAISARRTVSAEFRPQTISHTELSLLPRWAPPGPCRPVSPSAEALLEPLSRPLGPTAHRTPSLLSAQAASRPARENTAPPSSRP